jgi:hypothetical protein
VSRPSRASARGSRSQPSPNSVGVAAPGQRRSHHCGVAVWRQRDTEPFRRGTRGRDVSSDAGSKRAVERERVELGLARALPGNCREKRASCLHAVVRERRSRWPSRAESVDSISPVKPTSARRLVSRSSRGRRSPRVNAPGATSRTAKRRALAARRARATRRTSVRINRALLSRKAFAHHVRADRTSPGRRGSGWTAAPRS